MLHYNSSGILKNVLFLEQRKGAKNGIQRLLRNGISVRLAMFRARIDL